MNYMLHPEILRDLINLLRKEPIKQRIECAAKDEAQGHEETVEPGWTIVNVVHWKTKQYKWYSEFITNL